jgi:hypothetical protein
MGNVEEVPTLPDASTLVNPLVDVSGRGSFALSLDLRVPSPAILLDVILTLPSDRAAKIELLDLAGRRIEQHEVGTLGKGRHSVRLGGRSLPSGLYFVRLTEGTGSLLRKVCVIR